MLMSNRFYNEDFIKCALFIGFIYFSHLINCHLISSLHANSCKCVVIVRLVVAHERIAFEDVYCSPYILKYVPLIKKQ